jgi:O-antigen ligase
MKRDGLLLLVALLLLAGSIFAALGTAEQRDRDLRGYVNPAQSADLPYAVPRPGVNAELTQYALDDEGRASVDGINAVRTLDSVLDQMQAAGVYWVRQPFYLNEGSSADAPISDGIVQAFDGREGMSLVAVLEPGSTPPAEDPAVYAEAARAFAQRYGDVIDVYQVFDEPNLRDSWGSEPFVTQYAAILQAVYSAIHSADAEATVLAAALAPTLENTNANISDLLYLDDLYRLGLADFSDGIAAKPYGFDQPPTAEADADVLNFQRIALLRELMQRHGDESAALWISEYGWNSLPTGWTGAPSIWGQVSAEQQAAYTQAAQQLVAERFPWVGGMIVSHWQPNVPADDARWGFALVGQDDQPVRTAFMVSPPEAAAAPIGLHHPANAYTRYSGVWTIGERGADIGWVGDSQLSFTFAGDSVALLMREGDYTAYLYATIDGQPANLLPRDAADNAYVVLTSDSLLPETRLIPLASGLGDGVHSLQLVADRGWDQWAFAGIAVGGRDLAEPYNRQITLAGLTALVSAAAAVVFAAQIRWRAVFAPLHGMAARLSDVQQLALSLAASLILMFSLLLTWTEAAPAFFRREPIQLGLALLSAGLLYVNLALPLSIIAAVVLFLLFVQRPLHGLLLTLFFAPFFLFPVELFRFAFPMSELLVLITFAAWLARTVILWAKERIALSPKPLALGVQTVPDTQYPIPSIIDLLLLAYLALGIVSLLWTEYRDVALTEVRTLFVETILFYIVLRTTLAAADRPTQAQMLVRLVDAVVLSGIVVALIGLFLYARGDAIITAEEGARRLASVYGSPNNVGLWLGRCLPFALAFVLLPLDRRRRWFGGAALAVYLPALILTQSAGALFVGVPVAIAVTLLAARGRRAWLPLAGLAAAGVAALPVLLQFPRFARLLDPTEGTNFFRLRVWQSGVAMIRDHPLLGIGQDQFLYAFRGQYILPDAWQEPNLSHPHNLLLEFWLRLGLLGALLAIALHLVLVRALLRGRAWARSKADSPLVLALMVGALGCLANLVAHGMIDNSVFLNDLVYVFMLLCAVATWTNHVTET